ncbi:MAG: type II secretion system major pseudopilin GspG [Phycisphaerales bacterium]|nr:type II secretion system major pseudopilin GspG [Phycisphaerales bacterium]
MGSHLATIRRGMTLIEVMAVVVILAMLAGVLTISVRGQMGTAKRELAKSGIGVIVAAIETYSLETGRLPTIEEGLGVLTSTSQDRGEPYLKPDKLTDPWSGAYVYITPGPLSAYQVVSYGADHAPGGSGLDADITSDDLGATRERGSASP